MLKNLKIKFTSRLAVFLLVIVVFALFWGITKSFYQQDEWHGLGDILFLGNKFVFLTIPNYFQLVLGGGRLLGNFFVYFFYKNFPLNIFPIALFAIGLHAINTILVFALANKVTKKVLPAFLGALFFAINGVSQGAVTWPASAIATLPATFLVILSLFSFFEFIQKGKGRWVLISFLLLYISLFFKETAVPFFFLLSFSVFLFRKYSVKDFLKRFWIFLLFCATVVFSRLFQFKSISTQQDLFLTGASKSFLPTLFIRAVLYPLTSFSLIWFPTELIFTLAKHLTWLYYPFISPELYDLVAQTAVLDGIAVFLTVAFLFILFIIFKNSRTNVKRYVIFFVSLILISFLPYIVISKSFAYLESRYYYLSAVGVGVLLALVVSRFSEWSRVAYKLCVVSVLAFFLIHLNAVKIEVARQVMLGQERVKILNEISAIKPTLGLKTVFYLTGDRNYYITKGNNIPMQQGMGYTLLVWYTAWGRDPEGLISLVGQHYLWELDGEGYKEVNGGGFGYFWDVDKLKEFVKKNRSGKFDFVGLYYDSKKQEIINITKDLKLK